MRANTSLRSFGIIPSLSARFVRLRRSPFFASPQLRRSARSRRERRASERLRPPAPRRPRCRRPGRRRRRARRRRRDSQQYRQTEAEGQQERVRKAGLFVTGGGGKASVADDSVSACAPPNVLGPRKNDDEGCSPRSLVAYVFPSSFPLSFLTHIHHPPLSSPTERA